MRYFVVFLFLWFSTATVWAQSLTQDELINGTITNDNSQLPIGNVNIINLNKVIGTVSNAKGYFEIRAAVNDTLVLS